MENINAAIDNAMANKFNWTTNNAHKKSKHMRNLIASLRET